MTKVWEQVQVNMIGPFSLLAEDKYRYVLTVLDLYSRHLQVINPLGGQARGDALVFRVAA